MGRARKIGTVSCGLLASVCVVLANESTGRSRGIGHWRDVACGGPLSLPWVARRGDRGGPIGLSAAAGMWLLRAQAMRGRSSAQLSPSRPSALVAGHSAAVVADRIILAAQLDAHGLAGGAVGPQEDAGAPVCRQGKRGGQQRGGGQQQVRHRRQAVCGACWC